MSWIPVEISDFNNAKVKAQTLDSVLLCNANARCALPSFGVVKLALKVRILVHCLFLVKVIATCACEMLSEHTKSSVFGNNNLA